MSDPLRWRSIPLGGALLAGALGLSVIIAFHQERKANLTFEDALRGVEKGIETKHRPKWVAALQAACRAQDCDCAKRAAGLGLDADANDAVLALLDRAQRCEPSADFEGLRAEALVRRGDGAGAKLAEGVMARASENPNAFYALALSSYRARSFPKALELAEASERAGRGYSATLLAGLVA